MLRKWRKKQRLYISYFHGPSQIWLRGVRRIQFCLVKPAEQGYGVVKIFEGPGSGKAFRLRLLLQVKRPEGSGSGQIVRGSGGSGSGSAYFKHWSIEVYCIRSIAEKSWPLRFFLDEYSRLVMQFFLDPSQYLTQLWEVKGKIFAKLIFLILIRISLKLLIVATQNFHQRVFLVQFWTK